MEVDVCIFFDVLLTGDLHYIRYLHNNERPSLRLTWTIFFLPSNVSTAAETGHV